MSKHHFSRSFLSLFLILSIGLMDVSIVLADGPAPTPETEDTTQEPTATQVPAATEPPTAEEVTLKSDQPPAVEEAAGTGPFSLLPENTEVVVLDESGNPIPLVSLDALDAILEGDPMWCPGTILPNTTTCRNFTGSNGISNLLLDMRNNTSIYDVASATIYFTADPGNGSFALTDATLYTTGDYNALKDTNIVLQGGWNGSTSNPLLNTQTNFGSDYFHVGTSANPWTGNVTINRITIDGYVNTTNPSMAVYTTSTGSVTMNNVIVNNGDNNDGIRIATGSGNVNLNTVDVNNGTDGNGVVINTNSGNITLSDVDVANQADGYTANITSTSGNIVVQNGSSFDGDNTGGDTNRGFNASTGTGSITLTGTSSNRITFDDAIGSGTGTNYSGATLTAPNVTLNFVSASDNDGSGILINATTSVTLNNVIADNNGTNPTGTGNSIGSGATVNGDGSMTVTVTGGTFTNNDRYGIEVVNGTLNFTSLPTFGTNNVLGAYYPGGQDMTGPVITPTVSCILGSWGTNGWCRGLVTLDWNVTDPNTPVSSTTGCSGSFLGLDWVITDTPPTGQVFTCSATSADGTLTSSNSVTVFRDITPPTVTGATRTPPPNAYGWNNTDVTVTFNGTDASSGIATCTSVTRTAAGSNQSASGTCTDMAGNTSAPYTINNINIDKVSPTITLISRTLTNANGWNNGDVTLTWSCTDTLSGVVFDTVTQTVSTEGSNQSATGTCVDKAGNSASNTQTGINIDKTAPVLQLPGNMMVEATSPLGATVNYSAKATDNLDAAPDIVCAPVSGTLFGLGTTTVSCTATDQAGNTSSGSFTVNVGDTTPPVITQPADITVTIHNIFGSKLINYALPTATDIVDPNPIVTCTPASGSSFKVGDWVVTCTAMDASENVSMPVTFTIHIVLEPLAVLTSPLIPVTGGEIFDLDCNTAVVINGIEVIFYNLCDQQAILTITEESTLPGTLPSGFAFVSGLDVSVLDQGQRLETLPTGSGVEMDFPVNAPDQFAVLFWMNGQWVEITQSLNEGDLIAALSNDTDDELYKLISSETGQYKILTTELTGIFVLVKK